MKIVSVSFYWFQSIPFYSQCEMGILLKTHKKGWGVFTIPQQVISTITLFYYYGRIPQGFTFLWKLELLLFKLRWDNQSMKMKGIAMMSWCNRTSKDKQGDLFSFFFFLARLKISVDSRNYNPCVESMPETDFGTPSMPEILARWACWVWITYY